MNDKNSRQDVPVDDKAEKEKQPKGSSDLVTGAITFIIFIIFMIFWMNTGNY